MMACLKDSRLREMVLAQVRRRGQLRIRRRHLVQEEVLHIANTFVNVCRKELQPQLGVEQVIANTTSTMRRMRIHTNDQNLAMDRTHSRTNV